MRTYERFSRIGATSRVFRWGSSGGGIGVAGPSLPWPETPRRASLTARGSVDPLRSVAPSLSKGENPLAGGRLAGRSTVVSTGAGSEVADMVYLQLAKDGTTKRMIAHPE